MGCRTLTGPLVPYPSSDRAFLLGLHVAMQATCATMDAGLCGDGKVKDPTKDTISCAGTSCDAGDVPTCCKAMFILSFFI